MRAKIDMGLQFVLGAIFFGFGLGGLAGSVMGAAIFLAFAEGIYQQANPGEHLLSGEDMLKAIGPYVEPSRSRSEVDRRSSHSGGSGGPGGVGLTGASSVNFGLYGGPDLYIDLPPNPGCPCGDGLPGGGHLGASVSTHVSFGFGGFGGFGGF